MSDGIELIDIVKRYGERPDTPPAVAGVSLDIPKGTLATILGPSGCGKTTILRMIAGLESPSAGRIVMDGRDVPTLGPAERNVSMMFQSYALFPHLTVLGNVAYGLRMSGVNKTDAARRAQAALKSVGLVGYDERLPSELSGGQQQRVALARALVLEPAILLFDEPLSNLDARLRREMREEIRSLQQRLNLTVAYVTHDQSEALAVSDQIIVMSQGRVAQRGTPAQLYGHPASEFVAGFMGDATVLPGEALEGGLIRLGALTLRPGADDGARAAGPVKVAVRPEAWRLGVADGMEATLRKAAYLGSFYEYDFDTPLGPIFVVSGDLSAPLAPGARTRLGLGERGVSVVAA